MPDEMYRRVDARKLERLITAVYEKCGLPSDKAAFTGQCLVDADLCGVHSHGSRWAPTYARSLRAGGINAKAEPKIVQDRDSAAIVDGDRGVGHIAVAFAMQLAIQKAKQYGSSTVSIRHNGHCGAMRYYTQLAADAGCIGFAATTGGTMIAPWGGLERRVGLNPISWAAPTGRYGEDQSDRGGGQIVQAIDIEHYQPLDEFKTRMDRMVDSIKSSKRRDGVAEIFIPGELEYRRRQDYLKNGIPLDIPTRDSLRKDAEESGVPYDIEL